MAWISDQTFPEARVLTEEEEEEEEEKHTHTEREEGSDSARAHTHKHTNIHIHREEGSDGLTHDFHEQMRQNGSLLLTLSHPIRWPQA